MLTAPRVSTITANGFVGLPLALDQLFVNLAVLPVSDKTSQGFIFAEYKVGVNVLKRGENPRAKVVRGGQAPTASAPSAQQGAGAGAAAVLPQDATLTDGSGIQRFINQITTVYRMSATQMPNIKIFHNGNLQMTGIKRVEDGEALVSRIVEDIRACGSSVCTDPSALASREFIVRMINANFEAPTCVSRVRLFEVLRSETSLQIMFEANNYQALKLHYYFNASNPGQNGCCSCNAEVGSTLCEGKGKGMDKWDCKRVTLAVFETGRMLISGATTMAHVNHLYAFVSALYGRHATRIGYQRIAR